MTSRKPPLFGISPFQVIKNGEQNFFENDFPKSLGIVFPVIFEDFFEIRYSPKKVDLG